MLADCGAVSSERFALAHRRSLTYIKRKTYQDNAMHIWGAPRRVIGGPRWRNRERTKHLTSSRSDPLRLSHHSDSLITQTHSS
eukprot:266163-Pyramimonas_sp.AAC.1